MNKHTPGPWHVSIDPDEPEVVANLHTSGLAHFLIVPSEENTLGDIAADAKLCAAAPDMLSALLYVREMIESGQELGMSRVNAAIAQALGAQA